MGAETLARFPGQKLIFVRTSVLPFMEKYMAARLPEEEQHPLLFYSMWKGCKQTAAVGAVAAAITLGLFFSNRAKSGSILQGILMTVWQLFLGLVVFGILEMLDNWRKKRK